MKLPIVTEDDDTDIISFQVEGHTSNSGSELDHFSGLHLVKSDHSSNTVTDADDRTEFFDVVLQLDNLVRLE